MRILLKYGEWYLSWDAIIQLWYVSSEFSLFEVVCSTGILYFGQQHWRYLTLLQTCWEWVELQISHSSRLPGLVIDDFLADMLLLHWKHVHPGQWTTWGMNSVYYLVHLYGSMPCLSIVLCVWQFLYLYVCLFATLVECVEVSERLTNVKCEPSNLPNAVHCIQHLSEIIAWKIKEWFSEWLFVYHICALWCAHVWLILYYWFSFICVYSVLCSFKLCCVSYFRSVLLHILGGEEKIICISCCRLISGISAVSWLISTSKHIS